MTDNIHEQRQYLHKAADVARELYSVDEPTAAQVRRAHNLLRTGRIPSRKLGRLYVVDRDVLHKTLAPA